MNPQNSGLLPDPRSAEEKAQDYIMSAETGIVFEERISASDWKQYMPYGESQSVPGHWDTMCCTDFSSGHVIESQIIWLLQHGNPSPEASAFFQQFMTNPNDMHSLRISKRFNAIKSGTTIFGNYFQSVWDAWRKFGVIPDDMLPFGGSNFHDYVNPKLITQDMLDMGKESLEYIDIMYEWVQGYDGMPGFTGVEYGASEHALKQAPLNIGIPIPAGHAITMFNIQSGTYGVLDHYVPFIRENSASQTPIHYALKGVVTFKKPIVHPERPNHYFAIDLTWGADGAEVIALQKVLVYEGLLSPKLVTGHFRDQTKAAVIKFQERYAADILTPLGLAKGTGNVKSATRVKLNSVYFKQGL